MCNCNAACGIESKNDFKIKPRTIRFISLDCGNRHCFKVHATIIKVFFKDEIAWKSVSFHFHCFPRSDCPLQVFFVIM